MHGKYQLRFLRNANADVREQVLEVLSSKKRRQANES